MATGDIIGEIASLDFDLTGGTLPKIIHIAGTTYAIAYQGGGNDGWLKTFSISGDGVTLAEISFLEFDPVQGRGPSIIHISGEVYAIAYSGPGNNGIVITLTISGAGVIGDLSAPTTFEDGGGVIEPIIVHISGTTYAIFYAGPDNDGWLKTITIADDGTIGAILDTEEFDETHGTYVSPLHIAGDVWAIAYTATGINGPGRLKTLTIAGDGTITLIAGSSDYSANQTDPPDLFHIAGEVYGIAYGGPGSDGWLRTIAIEDGGTIGALIDFLEFDESYGGNPSVTPVGGNIWAIAYTGPGADGWLRTIEIEDDGTITGEHANHEFDDDRGSQPTIIHIADHVYAITYRGPGNDGWIKTVEIETPAEAGMVGRHHAGQLLIQAVM